MFILSGGGDACVQTADKNTLRRIFTLEKATWSRILDNNPIVLKDVREKKVVMYDHEDAKRVNVKQPKGTVALVADVDRMFTLLTKARMGFFENGKVLFHKTMPHSKDELITLSNVLMESFGLPVDAYYGKAPYQAMVQSFEVEVPGAVHHDGQGPQSPTLQPAQSAFGPDEYDAGEWSDGDSPPPSKRKHYRVWQDDDAHEDDAFQ